VYIVCAYSRGRNYGLVHTGGCLKGRAYRYSRDYRLVYMDRRLGSRDRSLLIVYSRKIVYRLIDGQS